MVLFDGQGSRREAVILELGATEARLELGGGPEGPGVEIDHAVAVAVPKGRRLDEVVRQVAELGLGRFFPLVTARTVVKPQVGAGRWQRWGRIAAASAKQCRRDRDMQIEALLDWEGFLEAAGSPKSAVCYKAMADSATFAVNATVANVLVRAVAFSIYMTEAAPRGMLIARGRFIGISGDHFMAESLLTDSEGAEIARGNGTFVATDMELTDKVGYK